MSYSFKISLEMQVVLEAYETKSLSSIEINELLRHTDIDKL